MAPWHPSSATPDGAKIAVLDENPIHTDQFGSNWELSSTRALSVVHYLIAQGVPPTRLAAVGFGEFQPIDPGNDEIGFRRNRRIELKLTSR